MLTIEFLAEKVMAVDTEATGGELFSFVSLEESSPWSFSVMVSSVVTASVHVKKARIEQFSFRATMGGPLSDGHVHPLQVPGTRISQYLSMKT